MSEQYSLMHCPQCNADSQIPANTKDGSRFHCDRCQTVVRSLIRCVKCGHFTSAQIEIKTFNYIDCVHCGERIGFLGKNGHVMGMDENLVTTGELEDPTAQAPPSVVQPQVHKQQVAVPPPAPVNSGSAVWNVNLPLPPPPPSSPPSPTPMGEPLPEPPGQPETPTEPSAINWTKALPRILLVFGVPFIVIMIAAIVIIVAFSLLKLL